MRQFIFHLLLLIAIWMIVHGSPVEFIWQIYPIIWFILLVNLQFNFLTFLLICFIFGFIADFEIISIFDHENQGLFWGFSSIFIMIAGGIQRLAAHSISMNIIYIGFIHEVYRFIIKFNHTNTSYHWGSHLWETVLNLIFLLSISTLVFLIQERVNPKGKLI
mgnify:CR=1 FL=1